MNGNICKKIIDKKQLRFDSTIDEDAYMELLENNSFLSTYSTEDFVEFTQTLIQTAKRHTLKPLDNTVVK